MRQVLQSLKTGATEVAEGPCPTPAGGQVLIRPLIYLYWVLGVIYRYVPQPILWLLLVLVMIYLSLGHLVGRLDEPAGQSPRRVRPAQGPVQELATQIERKEGGIYFKWQIARTLGQIAMDMQELRLHNRSRKLELDGNGTSPQVQRFLDAGLNTSFSDYPLPTGLPLPAGLNLPGRSKTTPVTPFDGDIGPVIDYLESKMENDDDLRRP